MAEKATVTLVTGRADPGRARRGSVDRAWLPALRQVPVLSGLTDRHLRKVAALATVARFDRSTTVARQGDRGDAFYVILDGRARVTRRGRSATRLGNGDHFGEMALIDRGMRSATVVAETDLTALRIGHAAFLKLIRNEPGIALLLLQSLSGRVRELEKALNDSI